MKDARRQYRDAKTLFFLLVHQVQEVLGNKQLNPYRRGFTLKPPKPVDRHTIDNFLKELKSYSLVLFPGTAATVLFEVVRKSGNFLTLKQSAVSSRAVDSST